MESTLPKPVLTTYLNVHDYLKDVYEHRKAEEPGFSYDVWAKELGLANRSFLRQIIIGRRSLTEETSHLFSTRFGLSDPEQEYFQLLVLYSNARTPEKRAFLWERMRPFLEMQFAPPLIAELPDFILKTLYPRLQALLGYKDAPKDAATLARLLKSSQSEAEEALHQLEKMGLVEKQEALDKIQWQAKTKSFKVPEDLGNEKLLDYHASCLQEAISARALPPEERRYRSLLLAFSDDEFKEFLKDFENFVRQSFHKYDGDELAQRKLYQINFNMHVVSSEKDAEP